MIRNSTLLVMLFLGCVCNAGESLQFRFQPGDKFSLVSVAESKRVHATDAPEKSVRFPGLSPGNSKGISQGNEEVTEQTLRLECDFDVEEVDQSAGLLTEDGNAWAKYTYRRVVFKSKGGGVDMEYDSNVSKQKVPPQILPLHLAQGESFFIKVTPQGRIDKINGLSAVMGNAKSKIPNIAERDQIIQLVERYFDEAAIKRELESELAVFPDSAIKSSDIGDTWSRRESVGNDTTLLKWTWRLSEHKRIAPDIIAVVDVNELISPASPETASSQTVAEQQKDQPEVTIGGVKTKSVVKGRGFGRIEIDEATGRIVNSILTQDLVETILLLPEGPIRRPPPAPAPTRTHITTTFQMIKRLPDEVGDSNKPPAASEANQP